MQPYLFEYNPAWPDWYIAESQQIKSAAPIDIHLYHIGSTAIPNMHAKQCIDILAEINDFEQGKKLIKPLQGAGFEYRGEYGIQGRHYFSKNKNRKVHLHVFVKGSAEINKHLHYVEVMSNNPKLVEEFIVIKNKLHAQFPDDKDRYQQEKQFFYEKISQIKAMAN